DLRADFLERLAVTLVQPLQLELGRCRVRPRLHEAVVDVEAPVVAHPAAERDVDPAYRLVVRVDQDPVLGRRRAVRLARVVDSLAGGTQASRPDARQPALVLVEADY